MALTPLVSPDLAPTLGAASYSPAAAARYGLRMVPVAALTAGERDAMRALLAEYYEGVTAEQFAADLAEKEWVVLGTTADDAVWCFSTLRLLRATVNGEALLAFYSGDSVVRRECWGRESAVSVGVLLAHMFAAAAQHPGRRAYWFMISSTYKSYRLLSQLFLDYGPRPERPLDAAERRVVAELSRLKAFTAYDADRSVVRFGNASRFRDDAARDGTASRDPAARFFAAANPGAGDGDRLAALAELRPDNLTPVGRRLLGLSA